MVIFGAREATPRDRLDGVMTSSEAQGARGHWNAYGELQKFQFTYRAIPTFNENTGYAEVRRVLGPRWDIAERVGYVRSSAAAGRNVYESAVGFRPNRYQLFKVGYEIQRGPDVRGTLDNICAIQFVTAFCRVSNARDRPVLNAGSPCWLEHVLAMLVPGSLPRNIILRLHSVRDNNIHLILKETNFAPCDTSPFR